MAGKVCNKFLMSPFLLHIALINLLDLAGTICAKFWSINKNPWLLVGTFLLFGSAGFFFARSLRYEGMAITNVLWISISVILVTIVGYFTFRENIAPIQLVGIAVIMVGLVLINLK